MQEQIVNVFQPALRRFRPQRMHLDGNRWLGLEGVSGPAGDIYLSPGFIDGHAHIYPGATDLGIPADRIGLSTGVHLVVDAGSAGSVNFPCFRDYVVPSFQVGVRAFLNISRVGLVTKQPYYDRRNLDLQSAIDCVRQDESGLLLGIKVLSSGLIVEDAGLRPLELGVQAARALGCPVMAHLVEGPPSNEETMALLQRGDIITHCFHGAPNLDANRRAAKGNAANPAYCSMGNVMWNEDGSPTRPLARALERGVLLDVGHGAASLDQRVARAAIAAGVREFSISSDAHIRNIDTIVYSLPHTMSKFMALGMSLAEVVAAVTVIPAHQLGLAGWCDDLSRCATLFRLRPTRGDDPPFVDAFRSPIPASQLVEPLAVVTGGVVSACQKSPSRAFLSR